MRVEFRLSWGGRDSSPRARLRVAWGPFGATRELRAGAPGMARGQRAGRRRGGRRPAPFSAARLALAFGRRARLDAFEVALRVGLEDPALTALAAGLAHAVLWQVAAALATGLSPERWRENARPRVSIHPDFGRDPASALRLRCIWSRPGWEVMRIVAGEIPRFIFRGRFGA